MVLSRKRLGCPIQVWNKLLSKVGVFKCLGVLFMSEGRGAVNLHDIRVDADAASDQLCERKRLVTKVKLTISPSIYNIGVHHDWDKCGLKKIKRSKKKKIHIKHRVRLQRTLVLTLSFTSVFSML